MGKYKVCFINDGVHFTESSSMEEIPNRNRLVFVVGERILKVDNWYCVRKYGYDSVYLQCKNEYENWKKIKKTKYSKYFVPILQHGCTNKRGYHYNVQPKIHITDLTPTKKQIELFFEIIDFFAFIDISLTRNVSILDSENFLIYDYSF